MESHLFADNTILFASGTDTSLLIDSTRRKLDSFLEWVKLNQLTVNWKKTKVMFISNMRNIKNPGFIPINAHEIEVVEDFLLLGIVIDDKLSFNSYYLALKQSVNSKLFSMK